MNKNRFFLIIQREYLSLVAKKSFLVMTILMQFLIILLGAIPALLATINSTSEEKVVAIVDETGKYASTITSNESFTFKTYDQATNGNPRQIYDKEGDELYAIVVIPKDIEKNKQLLVYSESSVSLDLKSHIEDCMDETLTDAKIKSYGIDGLDKILKECNVKVDVRSIKWSDNGDEEISSTEISMIIGMALSMLSYFFVLMYGAMIMNSVIEEKTNRIVEVIVSSCKPFQLMMGKIIGVALVGLTQFLIWAVIISGLAVGLGIGLADSGPMSEVSNLVGMVQSVNLVGTLVCFVIYFLGGYLLYAALFAGFGSAVDQASDASQFTAPIIIVMIVALYAGLGCMENPNGTFALWCSMIPFTSPIVMMVRLPYDVPFWQIAVSVVALYATATAIIWLSARIYRIGILRYGKKFTLKEILTWIKTQ